MTAAELGKALLQVVYVSDTIGPFIIIQINRYKCMPCLNVESLTVERKFPLQRCDQSRRIK